MRCNNTLERHRQCRGSLVSGSFIPCPLIHLLQCLAVAKFLRQQHLCTECACSTCTVPKDALCTPDCLLHTRPKNPDQPCGGQAVYSSCSVTHVMATALQNSRLSSMYTLMYNCLSRAQWSPTTDRHLKPKTLMMLSNISCASLLPDVSQPGPVHGHSHIVTNLDDASALWYSIPSKEH